MILRSIQVGILAGVLLDTRPAGVAVDFETQEGSMAVLVILEADPLQDIRNTSRIWQVIQDGGVVDRPGLLAWAKKHLQP